MYHCPGAGVLSFRDLFKDVLGSFLFRRSGCIILVFPYGPKF